MDWAQAWQEERRTIERVIATLFALALLARRASAMPRPVRHLLLWILRPAEAAVRQFVLDLALGSDGANAPLEPLFMRHDRRDGLRLARRFRAYAHLLKRQLRQLTRLAEAQEALSEPGEARRHAVTRRDLRRAINVLLHRIGGLAPEAAPDTS